MTLIKRIGTAEVDGPPSATSMKVQLTGLEVDLMRERLDTAGELRTRQHAFAGVMCDVP